MKSRESTDKVFSLRVILTILFLEDLNFLLLFKKNVDENSQDLIYGEHDKQILENSILLTSVCFVSANRKWQDDCILEKLDEKFMNANITDSS